ncbi:MAG TPA: hypothetical protein VGL75_08825 [Acidothermaceae bacterium]|jgi:hypothetical protein
MDDDGQSAGSFRIERVRSDHWVSLKGHPSSYDATGEQWEWGFAIPWIFRALASPLTHERIPAPPRAGDSNESAVSYWESLLYLLIYSFGWARPDLGLRWWYDSGKPVDDPRLQLLSQIWDADGQLDWFAGWLWTTPWISHDADMATFTGYVDRGEKVNVDRGWLDATRARAEAFGGPVPFRTGGTDPLHLSMHSSGPLRPTRGNAALVHADGSQRRAVLVCESMIGWYRELVVQGNLLPATVDHSWHVDVVVRPVGWLGTYRRSRVTGLWFAGHHRHHLPGT